MLFLVCVHGVPRSFVQEDPIDFTGQEEGLKRAKSPEQSPKQQLKAELEVSRLGCRALEQCCAAVAPAMVTC